jgi:hypothetical protein
MNCRRLVGQFAYDKSGSDISRIHDVKSPSLQPIMILHIG